MLYLPPVVAGQMRGKLVALSSVAVLLGMSACTPTPEVLALDPHTVDPGQTVRVLGQKFDAAATVAAVDGNGQSRAFPQVTVAGAGVIEATIPVDLASGAYRVQVEQGGKTSSAPKKLQVRTTEGELLCGPQRTMAEFSQVRKEVAIERFDPRRDPQRSTMTLPIKSIDGVEYEVLSLETGECRVIRLKTSDGRRVVFADDDSVDLKDRAWALGKAMNKPVQVLGEAL
jgi:hypothetical protein